jgi:hypothetical protein
MTWDPWGWPTPDDNGDGPAPVDPGEPDLPTLWTILLMRAGWL